MTNASMSGSPAEFAVTQAHPADIDLYGPSNPSSWIGDLFRVTIAASLLSGVTVAVTYQVIEVEPGADAGLWLTLAVVATYLYAILRTWRYRAAPALVATALAMSSWQWFAYAPQESWDWMHSTPNFAGMCAAGAVVGLSIALVAAVLSLGRPLRHARSAEQSRGTTAAWVAAALTLPVLVVWLVLVEPALSTHAITPTPCLMGQSQAEGVEDDGYIDLCL